LIAKIEARHEVRLRLICLTAPAGAGDAGLEFGLQDRDQQLHAGQAQPDGSVAYEITVSTTRWGESNAVRFRGSFIHGPPQEPFLYLSLRDRRAAPPGWIRRRKIPLAGLTWDQIAPAPAGAGFAARVAGSGSGTVPLLGGGWQRTG